MFFKNRFASSGKKKTSSFYFAIYWLVSFSISIWLVWLIFTGTQKGIVGETVAKAFFDFFGKSAYFFPFLFLYGLIAIILKLNKPHKGILTLFIGIFLILGAISAELELIRNAFSSVAFDGGWLGYVIEGLLSKLFGNIGAFLSGIVLFLLGIQLLFKVSWKTLIKKSVSALKDDYKNWTAARKELKSRLESISGKEDYMSQTKPVKPDGTAGIEEKTPEHIAASSIIADKSATTTTLSQQTKIIDSGDKKSPQEYAGQVKRHSLKQRDSYYKDFKLPSTLILDKPSDTVGGPGEEEISNSRRKLEETFSSFGISAHVSGIYPGPVITRYEVTPSPGVKISSIVSLADDIALAMKAPGIRVIPHVPGKSAIGFEIPNINRANVGLREIIESPVFNEKREPLICVLGKYSEGSVAVANLELMPHLLVAGATNSGKSVFLHSMIMSLIFRNTPDELKFLLIDPKRLELTFYEGIPYLYDPKVTSDRVSVVTQAKDAAKSLIALAKVMERRYIRFEKAKVKNIASYNRWAIQNNEQPEFYIVVVIDELADLILQAKNAVEDSIQRLSQMARAVGIHLVLATQRPSIDIITGVIKANLPSRIALQVTSKVDSRVILDINGAESLIGSGDLLYLASDAQKPVRIQGAYVSEEEIKKFADFLKVQAGAYYPAPDAEENDKSFGGKGGTQEEIFSAIKLILERKRVSQDLLKAHFGSSARATNLLSILEMNGFIHKPEGSNRWEIFFDRMETYLSEHPAPKEPIANDKERIENRD